MHISPKTKLKNPFKDLSPDDRKVLIACLAIAFVFWLLVKLSKNYTVHRLAHITYELPLGLNFSEPPPEAVGVDLSAKGWYFLISSFVGKDLDLYYKVPLESSFILSIYDLQVDISTLLKDKSVSISKLHFEGFNGVLEKETIKRLPVVVPYNIDFAAEYDLASPIKLNPDSITISGPISKIDTLTEWKTDSLILLNVDNDIKKSIPVNLAQNGIKYSHKEIEVSVTVERFTEKNIFVPVQIDSIFTDSIRLFPDKILLKCIMGLGHYDEVDAVDFILRANIDQTLINEGKSTAPLELISQPNYIRSVQFSPRVVEFFIVKKADSDNL